MSESPTPRPAAALTHVDAAGRANMVDVAGKPATARTAIAEATIRLDARTRALLMAGELPKGEALAVARIAGIQAAKETARLIPLCHPLALSSVAVEFAEAGDDGVRVAAMARTTAPTGVEMEAMVAASVAALTIYDMAKGSCRGAVIEAVQLVHKSGGASGVWQRSGTRSPEDPA